MIDFQSLPFGGVAVTPAVAMLRLKAPISCVQKGPASVYLSRSGLSGEPMNVDQIEGAVDSKILASDRSL
ncbi:hypothetical protein [Bradyrhizobium sp. BR 1432]|uniref:hypothetical protein n=1 Tax=Bradyrhizobium sp. BR 1432 TaxID=3447966 RepID=UPI003EE63684